MGKPLRIILGLGLAALSGVLLTLSFPTLRFVAPRLGRFRAGHGSPAPDHAPSAQAWPSGLVLALSSGATSAPCSPTPFGSWSGCPSSWG